MTWVNVIALKKEHLLSSRKLFFASRRFCPTGFHIARCRRHLLNLTGLDLCKLRISAIGLLLEMLYVQIWSITQLHFEDDPVMLETLVPRSLITLAGHGVAAFIQDGPFLLEHSDQLRTFASEAVEMSDLVPTEKFEEFLSGVTATELVEDRHWTVIRKRLVVGFDFVSLF